MGGASHAGGSVMEQTTVEMAQTSSPPHVQPKVVRNRNLTVALHRINAYQEAGTVTGKLTAIMELMRKTALPKFAKTMSSSVQMASAYPKSLFVTKIAIALMVQTSCPVPNLHVAPSPSSATTVCASQSCGAVTGM